MKVLAWGMEVGKLSKAKQTDTLCLLSRAWRENSINGLRWIRGNGMYDLMRIS